MDRLERYRVFIQVADTGSFIKAAHALGLSRATVSAAVQQLEAGLGTRLLHRTTRRVSLTPDGRQLRERLHPLLDDAEEIEQLFAARERRVSGHLSVDLPSRIARKLVIPALPALLERYPQLELTLGSHDRNINLVQEGVDCVIRVGAPADGGLVARPLGELAVVNCASAGYARLHGLPAHPDELVHHVAVGYASQDTGQATRWEYLDIQGQTRRLPVPCRVIVDDAESYLACCRAGLGLVQLPRYDVHELLVRKELVEVLAEWRPTPMPVTALYPHRRQRSRRLTVFIDWLQDLLAPHLQAPG
jgi:DNA-binding transcriptional LysR family regulator